MAKTKKATVTAQATEQSLNKEDVKIQAKIEKLTIKSEKIKDDMRAHSEEWEEKDIICDSLEELSLALDETLTSLNSLSAAVKKLKDLVPKSLEEANNLYGAEGAVNKLSQLTSDVIAVEYPMSKLLQPGYSDLASQKTSTLKGKSILKDINKLIQSTDAYLSKERRSLEILDQKINAALDKSDSYDKEIEALELQLKGGEAPAKSSKDKKSAKGKKEKKPKKSA